MLTLNEWLLITGAGALQQHEPRSTREELDSVIHTEGPVTA